MADGIRATPTIACTTSSLRNRSRCAKRRPPVSTVTNKANAMSSTGIWLGEVRPSGNACANTWRTPRFSRYLITANQSTPAADRFARITHFQAGRCPPKSATVALHRPVPPSDFRCVSQLNDIKGVLQDDAPLSLPQTDFFGMKRLPSGFSGTISDWRGLKFPAAFAERAGAPTKARSPGQPDVLPVGSGPQAHLHGVNSARTWCYRSNARAFVRRLAPDRLV